MSWKPPASFSPYAPGAGPLVGTTPGATTVGSGGSGGSGGNWAAAGGVSAPKSTDAPAGGRGGAGRPSRYPGKPAVNPPLRVGRSAVGFGDRRDLLRGAVELLVRQHRS